ncbi:MAG: endo-1,4-beta-xylanase [Spirochaetaceae bacterium]|jgi:GH35 family endo-1,4-beta-xylanase|nr:endo-1,4-beta-xylanase [Spirochaetaceae bacterium]
METNLNHRKAAVNLRLVTENGQPAANQEIKIEQRSHKFLFGVGGFEAVELAGGNPDGSAIDEARAAHLREKLDKLFAVNNYATLPFYLGRYEPEEGKPDERRLKAAARWFAGRGITAKGHPLCWHTVCAPWLMNYSNAEILKKIIARIERDVSAFAGLIDIWDVINEVVIMPIFDKYDNAVTRICKEYGQVRVVKEVFEAAKRANPNAVLLLNDFDTSQDYEILIDKCLRAGIPIDVIGIQSHQHQGYWGAEKLNDVLGRFSRFGLPLHFTENTLISGDLMPPHIVDLNDWQVEEWPTTPEGEERQSAEVTELYEILFAHPLVQAITTWSGGDNAWLHAPAGFLRTDNSEKPAYRALRLKIENEWSTQKTEHTDVNGRVTLEGFMGAYEISCMGKTALFELDGKDALELRLN